MKFLKIIPIVVILLIFAGKANAQDHLDPAQYHGDVIAYLTEVNMWLEGRMLLNYCNCAQNEDFVQEYQNVRGSYNSWLNSAVTKLGLMRGRKAVRAFESLNNNEWLKVNPEMNRAFQNLMRFSETDMSCSEQSIVPGIVTVAELTAIANSVVELLNETKKRRKEQKLLIIQTLEDLKIPPLQAYDCSG